LVQAEGQGTVTFNGKLIAETCKLATGSEDITVTLPTVSTQSLAQAANEGGSKSFDISVTDCPVAIKKVAAHFDAVGSTGYNAATGNLTNNATTSAASNVEVRLYNTDGTAVAVGSTGSSFDVDSNSNTAKLTYLGGYYATGVTTAGNVTAKVQYTLSYP
jgi:major type 1 subunit fimbrin (pilin)